jgi:hypothetical protein
MGDAVYAIPNFSGGEISAFAQGRFDKPDYRTSLNVCLNSFPNEIGAWTRRPGTMHGGTTRGGAAGRTIKFDFEQAIPYTLEFTDGKLRFRNGPALISTNDTQVVVAVSAADPAVVQTTSAADWVTGNTLIFSAPSAPLLENRQFLATKIDTTHFSLADAITGDTIDGSTLGAIASGATVSRVQELDTVYVGGTWQNVRAVQAETTDILLQASMPPQALTVTTLPADGTNAVFAINPALFNDGPYLDPFINGVQANPNQKTGIIQITLSFPAYDAATAYPVGAFVTSSSVNYRSLIDQNLNHTPASSPTAWVATASDTALNDGRGLLGTDIGRLVRLFSEPAIWSAATSYSAGNTVAYNPSGLPGSSTYWQAVTPVLGRAPGLDLAGWSLLPQNSANWSWGRIVSLTNAISGSLSGSTNIGTLTGNGGLAAAFDGNLNKVASASAAFNLSSGGSTVTVSGYVGKNYSGASAQRISTATYYPSLNLGFSHAFVIGSATETLITVNLRAKATAPASASDGTLLGTNSTSVNNTSPLAVTSSDSVTTWNYVWFEIIVLWGSGPYPHGDYTIYCGQAVFFGPPGTGTGNGFNLELLGPPLLYTAAIRTWRFGLYSNTTSWPTCGTYHEGRIWLGGAVANRFDSCVSNGILGGTLNFAPTDQYGVVAASSAISYTLNSDSVNPIYWFQPDLQGLIVGTQAGEWLVQAPTTGPLSPTNIAARRVTKVGCANVEPRRTDNVNVFVKRYRRKLMEQFADANFGKFSAPNIADKAGHIVSAGIAEIAYTEAVAPIIWGRDDAGALFGVTYKRDTLTTSQPPTYNAWHRHTLGSGRVVESICNGPSVGGDLDTLTMVTNDTDSNVRHVEILTDTPDENTELEEAWFLDNAVRPTSTSTTNTPSVGAPYGGLTINGLWHLNGETVQVFAGGLDCGYRGTGSSGFTDFLVTDGSCFVPYGDSVSAGSGGGLFTADFAATADIVVGFTYNSDAQMVRPIAPADSGARNGPALGKTRRNHQYSVLVSNTLGISFGGTFATALPALFRQANGNPIAALTMFSGVHHDTLSDDYSYDGMVCWRVSRPLPANVVALSGNIQTQDR